MKTSRYGSGSEVVCEGLWLVEERVAEVEVLRTTLAASIAAGGAVDDAKMDRAPDACEAELAREGIGA